MAKKLSVQTVAATARTMKKVAPSLSAEEERALRMRIGVGLAAGDRLEQKMSPGDAVATKLAQLELMAFRAMGAKVYGIGIASAASSKNGSPRPMRSPKDKIIKALKKR